MDAVVTWLLIGLRLLAVILGLLIGASQSIAQYSESYLVLGVIVNSKPDKSVALLKNTGNNRTLAVRVGQSFGDGARLISVRRKHVQLRVSGQDLLVEVGESTKDAALHTSYQAAFVAGEAAGVGYSGVEREGNTARVSAALRDHIINTDLSKVLMQAAAVPHYANGKLHGFSLHDIEPGSVYEQIGLRDGDLVTHINGQVLNDVANTIKLLKLLKEEPNASMTLVRSGQELNLSLVVQ